jgi:hypothetical protein
MAGKSRYSLAMPVQNVTFSILRQSHIRPRPKGEAIMTDRFEEEAWVTFLALLAKRAPLDTSLVENLTDVVHTAVERAKALSKSLAVQVLV